MKACGIIAEYDPFHNGHMYHISEARRMTGADAVIVVMSGDFTQRGRPSVLDKRTRASHAVRGGADLVIELPFAYACNHAGAFAKGAVRILDGLNDRNGDPSVTHLSFGSETGDSLTIEAAASLIHDEPEEFRAALAGSLSEGLSYPAARYEAALKTRSDAAAALRGPNDILGSEYTAALMSLKSDIRPAPVLRRGSYHGELPSVDHEYASASSIRNAFSEGRISEIKDHVPEYVIASLEESSFNESSLERLFDLVRFRFLTEPADSLADIMSVSEGLENRIKKSIPGSSSLEDLVMRVKSKRYTHTRINRVMIHSLTGLTSDLFKLIDGSEALCARVLGFNEKGARLIREIKDSDAPTKLITNINREAFEIEKVPGHKASIALDVLASDVYNLLRGRNLYEYSDRRSSPFILK